MRTTETHQHRENQSHIKLRGTRLHLTTRKALLLSMTVIFIGIWLSLNTLDWNWFARSGSLVVIIGILLTSSQVIENSRKLKMRRTRHDYNFNRDFAEDIKKHTLERSRSLDEDIWENGVRGLYLLVLGTLIWGFGDLVGLLLV